jgi:hypothetical protein
VARGRSGVAVGFTYFAAILMMLSGGFEILQGLSAIIRKHLYVVNSDYIYKISVTGWGWIHLILGVIVLLAGIALLGGALWARIVGIALAGLIAIANFLWLPYYPVWAIVLIALNVVIIWALAAHGRDIAAAR